MLLTNMYRQIKGKISRYFDKDFQSLRDLTIMSAEIARKQRLLQNKLSWTQERMKSGSRPWNMFDKLLFDEHEQNIHELQQLANEKAYVDMKISRQRCIQKVPFNLLTNEIIKCLNQGYALKSYTATNVIMEWHTKYSGSSRRLKLSLGRRVVTGASNNSLQSRLESYVQLFNAYREFAPAAGREKSVLDAQFGIDLEIKTIYWEMKYLGYTPNLGDYIL